MDDKITLNEGDAAVFERARTPIGAPQQWDVRLFRDGNDMGVAATIDRDGTLTVDGSGKNARIEIPQTVGQSRGDQIPQLNLETQNPVIITGGDFVLGTGTARVPANVQSLNDGPKQNNDAQLNGVDKRFAENAVSITYQDTEKYQDKGRNDGSRRTVTVEPVAQDAERDARIEFFKPGATPEQNTLIYAISGKDSYEATVEKYNAIDRTPPAKQEQLQQETKPEKEKIPLLPNDERVTIRDTIKGYVTKLSQLEKSSVTPDKYKGRLSDLIDTANDILPARMGAVNQEKLEAFHNKLDALINENDPSLTAPLKRIKSDLNKDENKALQISMVPSAMPLDAIAAATEAARNLTGNLAVIDYGTGQGQGNKVASATETTISNTRSVTS